MATKDRKKLQHIHSSIADKQPTPQSLEVGEIAVNNSANKEFLSLKNSNDKVVRFSSDSTIIDWIEKKEVMPYSGVVDNVHLDTNRSNIEIKINQVAAKNTPKYNKINGAVDIDGQPVNPSTDGGKTDGAGIAIDMSRYAMIGANPTFSSITVTHRSNLSGTTNISNGAGGTALNITTSDVTANDANWTETITNKKSTVTTEEDKITTLKESATTRTTVVGTENLTVSGTTTEVHTDNVSITNSANKQENTTGTHKVYTTGDTCINSQANANFYGKVSTNIGVACDGTTKGSATTVVGTTTLNMSGATTTISGNTTNVTGATTLNLSGNTINERALSAKTNVTSAYTSATTATTVIGTANTSAITATLSGNTLDITEATRLSAKTHSTTISGTNLTINESNTVISSCTKVDIITNDLNIKQCTTGTVDFDFCNGFTVNSNNIKLHECGSAGTINISAQTQNINGGNLTINESGNTKIYSTGTTYVVSSGDTQIVAHGNLLENASGDVNLISQEKSVFIASNGVNHSVDISANGNGSYVRVKAKEALCMNADNVAALVGSAKTNIGMNCNNGGDTTALNVRGVLTNISAGTLTETVTGLTNETHTGAVTINNGYIKTETTTGAVTENNKAGYTANTTGDTTVETSGTTKIHSIGNGKAVHINAVGGNNVVEISTTGNKGKIQVNAVGNESVIQMNSDDVLCLSGKTTAAFVGGVKTNIGKNCSDGGQATSLNLNGATINETGTTVNVSGSSAVNVSGGTINISGGTLTSTTTGNTCIAAGGNLTIGGDANTNIGYNCAGTGIANNTKIYASTAITLDAPSINISGHVYGLEDLTIQYGTDVSNRTSSTTYDGSEPRTVDIPTTLAQISYNYVVDSSPTTTGGTISIKKPTNITGKLNVTGDTTINGNTTVTGTTTLKATTATSISASTEVKSPSISGTNTSAGTLTVTGNTKLEATTAKTLSATSVSATTISGSNITASGAIRANNVSADTISATTFYGKMSKKLTWEAGKFSADTEGYNGSANKTITVPTAISHLTTRGKLTVTHNGLSDTYDPATDKSMTLPHSALTITYGTSCGKSGSVTYDTSSKQSITIPTTVSNLGRAALKYEYGSVSGKSSANNGTYDPGEKTTCSGEVSDTIVIPTSVKEMKNWNGSCYNFDSNVCVTGNLSTTGGVYYTSDERLKENIYDADYFNEINANNVKIKEFNFKDDETKRKVYGVTAQDVLSHNLGNLVLENENGFYSVDYTSLMLLKIAFLENEVRRLEDKLNKLS